jgi:hypothetical protein
MYSRPTFLTPQLRKKLGTQAVPGEGECKKATHLFSPSMDARTLWDGAKKLDTTISQEAILKDTGVTRKCDNIQKNSNAK